MDFKARFRSTPLSAKEQIMMLRSPSNFTVAVARKDHPSCSVGLRLWSSPNREILIVHLEPDCMFQHQLKRGMRLDAINDVCVTSVSQANDLLKNAVGRIELITSPPGSPPSLVMDDDCLSDCAEICSESEFSQRLLSSSFSALPVSNSFQTLVMDGFSSKAEIGW